MRTTTRKTYEKRIESLQERLDRSLTRNGFLRRDLDASERRYEILRTSRHQGVEARQWAIEEAIQAGMYSDLVAAAQQIADYVYGPDFEADREGEQS